MPRYRLTIEFDGTPFCGWQRQTNALSIQQVIEEAGRRFVGTDTPVYGAGRTDAGVHATGMVAHIDLPRAENPFTVMNALNALMRGHPISLLSASAVPDGFHARHDCVARSYLYRLIERRSPTPLMANRAWRITQKLDSDMMHRAAQALVGQHDFTTFRSVHCQAKSPIKTLSDITVDRSGEDISITLHARSFLHNQVRSIVGSLVQVGIGRWPEAEIANALAAADRSRCGPVAPAAGLYFVKAHYDSALN